MKIPGKLKIYTMKKSKRNHNINITTRSSKKVQVVCSVASEPICLQISNARNHYKVQTVDTSNTSNDNISSRTTKLIPSVLD